MKAIDLYSGIGGWALGLRLAGLEVVDSYEWWRPAATTYEANFGRAPLVADIRALPLEAFPTNVDVVVGSPPCTQFSFSNRGGGGDIEDGLRDIRKFLQVVAHVQPKSWVMENVPRVASILERELAFGGSLAEYSDLVSTITVVDMTAYGLPQRRRRMLAGNFREDLLQSYALTAPAPPTLGRVITSLASDTPTDPLYGFSIAHGGLPNNESEPPLSAEETRLNREAKQLHPFYNQMAFPDPVSSTSRTITALCTRVSRESIVVQDGHELYRRLTLRERAVLQGFPITFQFLGNSHPENLKLVGNAIPPLLTYYLGCSLLGKLPDDVLELRELGYRHEPTTTRTVAAPLPVLRSRYPADRRFRAVLPHLRLGSGVRFELANSFPEKSTCWSVKFFLGTSKNVCELPLDEGLAIAADNFLAAPAKTQVGAVLARLERELHDVTPEALQSVWTHIAAGLHPFDVVDILDSAVVEIAAQVETQPADESLTFMLDQLRQGIQGGDSLNRSKLARNCPLIIAGFIIASWFNSRSALRDAGFALAV